MYVNEIHKQEIFLNLEINRITPFDFILKEAYI